MALQIIEPERLGRGRFVVRPGPHYYQTDFPLTESPISEGGAWQNNGYGAIVATASGLAHGTQAGGSYDDSQAHLTGFAADQTASATIYLDPTTALDTYRELEVLLRWATSSGNTARGYECNIAFATGAPYAEIVRWNGSLGDFTPLSHNTSGIPLPVTGDILTAQIIGTVITTSLYRPSSNTTYPLCTYDTAPDSTKWSSGNPGIGIWRGSGGSDQNAKYGFTHYSASDL